MTRADYLREARRRWAEYQMLCDRLDALDGSDPADREAARVWLEQAMHARSMAWAAERYADGAR